MADSTLPSGRSGPPPRRERWMQAQSLSQHSIDDAPRLRPDGPAATATKSPVVTRGVSRTGRGVEDTRAPSRDDVESTAAIRALRRRPDDPEATGAMRAAKVRRIDEVEATGAFRSMKSAPRTSEIEGTGAFRAMKGAPRRMDDVESTSRLRAMDGNRARNADRATEMAIRQAMSLEARAQRSQFDHVLHEDLKTMVLMIVGAFCVSLVVAVMLAMAT